MADTGLSGRLSDFTLEEILQLIGLQQKTGLLRVDASYPMALFFEHGILIGYRDRDRTGSDPLETFLKSYGYFAPENWEHIDFVQRHSQLDLADILVNEGLFSSEELSVVQMEAAQECLVNGMMLRDGRYQFLSGRGELEALRGRVRIKVESLLMEAVRRIDELPTLRKRFPTGSVKIRRTLEPADDATLGDGARRLLAAIEDETTLQAVTAAGKMSEFLCLETLGQLAELKLIAVQSLPSPEEQEKTRREEIDYEDSGPSSAAAAGLALVSVVIMLVVGLIQPAQMYASRATEGSVRAETLAERRAEHRLETARDLYARNHPGTAPTLQRLVDEGYLDADDATRASGTESR